MQPKCTHCGNSQCKSGKPSVHVLDVTGGKVVKEQFVCTAAAEALGILQPKVVSLSLSAEVLEQLSSGIKAKARQSRTETACPGCGLTLATFRERGRLGCPRCYDVFRPHLTQLLERIHDATTHCGRFPGRTDRSTADPVRVADLRESMRSAIAAERYEEAAQLRDEIRRIEQRAGGSGPRDGGNVEGASER